MVEVFGLDHVLGLNEKLHIHLDILYPNNEPPTEVLGFVEFMRRFVQLHYPTD